MGIANWFRRAMRQPRAILPEDLPDTPVNWEPGDVAVVRSNSLVWVSATTGRPTTGPARGQRLGVVAVGMLEGRQFLAFAAYVGCFHAWSFDRLRGDQAEACEEEFISLVRRDFVRAPKETVE